MPRLQIIGSNIKLNGPEKQIMQHLMDGAGLTEEQALEQVLSYIREQVIVAEQNVNLELAQHLLERIDEWTDVHEDRHNNIRKTHKPLPKIYLPQ